MTPLPKVFLLFTNYWMMPDHLARTWWQALAKAQWSQAVAFRQAFLYHDVGVLGNRHAFIHKSVAPAKVMAVIENLVSEQTLSRKQASEIEEQVLTMVKHDGMWR